MTTSRERRSLTDAQVRQVRMLGREGWTLHAIAKQVGTSATVACNIVNGKAYRDIGDCPREEARSLVYDGNRTSTPEVTMVATWEELPGQKR